MRSSMLAVLSAAVMLTGGAAFAGNDNPECLGSSCGAPKEEGGGCGCGCGCSVWVAYTDDGKTLAYTDDADSDGKADDTDNCPFASNRDQLDGDGDGVGNSCDNCQGLSNFSQLDTDGDGTGDTCDSDLDGDGVANTADNCSTIPNPAQTNSEATPDATGDVCDTDDDNDGILDRMDACPTNADVTATTGPGCNVDTDNDNVRDAADNCPALTNTNQSDLDGDGQGDVCDLDADNDGINDKKLVSGKFEGVANDNCPGVANRNQFDDDGDKSGDACDSHYCVVVDPSQPNDCLDPKNPFQVHGGGSIMLKRGEQFRLPLFANRNGAGIEYTWVVDKHPETSKAAVTNATGVATVSRHWEYAYTAGNVPSFTADVDGTYSLQLQARLAVADRAYPDQRTSVAVLALNATPDGKPSGSSCSVVPMDASVAAAALGLMSLLSRRRRKS